MDDPLNDISEAEFPTPVSSGADSAGGSNSRRRQKTDGSYISGQLNPEWVTWLIGFPRGWLDIGTESPTSPESPSTFPTEPLDSER